MKYVFGLEGGVGGDIWKEGGVTIHFVLDNYVASDAEQLPAEKIAWRERLTRGAYHFSFAYTKERELIAAVTGSIVGNFQAKVEDQKQLAEVLLTILSLDTTRGYPLDSVRMEGPR
jgi:hypothetical protein